MAEQKRSGNVHKKCAIQTSKAKGGWKMQNVIIWGVWVRSSDITQEGLAWICAIQTSSWREKNITKSKEEAIEELKELREAIVSEAKGDDKLREVFEEYAESESDCSSAKRKGDLGPFGRREMQPSFEKASFALKVGELSEIIESNSGVHIILRYK